MKLFRTPFSVVWVCVVLCLAMATLGCGSGEDDHTKTVKESVGQAAETKIAVAPKAAAAVPKAATAAKDTTSPHDPAKGKVLYAQNCASCHGASGGGDGPVAAALVPKPAKHDDGNLMNPLTNDYLFKVVKQGGVSVGKSILMAAWGPTLSDEQIWDLVAFMRSLAQPPYTGPKP